MPDNTLLNFKKLPRFAEICPDDVGAAVDSVLTAAEQTADAVADESSPSWETVCAPLEAADEAIARVWNQVEHMHAVMSTPSWRAAYRDNLEKISAHSARMGQHEGVYQQLQTLTQSETLSPTQKKIVADALQDFQLSGIALADEQKTIFRRHSEKLSALSAAFVEHLLDATNDYALDIASEEDLGDMPPDLKQAAALAAGDNNSFRFTLQQPSYVAFMQYSPARKQRRELYYAYNTRASEFGNAARDNTPLVTEILELRAKQASLLGFDDYAHMALQTRMAGTPHEALDFLYDLAARAYPAAVKELEAMRAFAATELGIDDLQPWDVGFVSEHMCRRQFDFSDAELRPYLRVDKVLDGLFSCAEKLFGVCATAVPTSLWLPEAQYFKLHTRNGEEIGGLYLDLYARDTKRGGAWMADALSRCRRSGTLQLPVAHVTCNFAPPKAGSQALLNWDEAVTLFHEFGHALHHLLTEVEEFSASGISGVEWDAVELPSQFMENFIWDWRVLEPMTAHIKTGEPMPKALFDKALAARQFQSGLRLVRQLEFALFDLKLHSGTPRPFMAVLKEARQQTAVLPAPEWNRFPCCFSHIFAGGYAAGYYSYLWAEVLAADAFALFTESGDVLNAELGSRFRQEVLAVGGSRPAMQSFTAFRGRVPKPAALLKHYGLVD
jgi:oligopeptidase A